MLEDIYNVLNSTYMIPSVWKIVERKVNMCATSTAREAAQKNE